MRESVILRAVLEYLETRKDNLSWRNNTGAADMGGRMVWFGMKGSADVLGVWAPSGRFIAVETKAPRGQLSSDQARWAADFTSCGGLYIIARSVHDVEKALGPPQVRLEFETRKRVYHGAV